MAWDKHRKNNNHAEGREQGKSFFSRFFEPVPEDTDGYDPMETDFEEEDDFYDASVTETEIPQGFDPYTPPFATGDAANPFTPPPARAHTAANVNGQVEEPRQPAQPGLPAPRILLDTAPVQPISPVVVVPQYIQPEYNSSAATQTLPAAPSDFGSSLGGYTPPVSNPSGNTGYVPLVSQVDAARQQPQQDGIPSAHLYPAVGTALAGVSNPDLDAEDDGKTVSMLDITQPEHPPMHQGSAYAASFLSGAAANAGIGDFTEQEKTEAFSNARPIRLFEDSGRTAMPDENDTGYDGNIRLFDDEEDVSASGRRHLGDTVKTRMFRTGTGTTTRIHLNETEESLRKQESDQRAREREMHQRREERRERENKRRQRQTMLKKLFGNIAFVLFFLAAVIVAGYYGFLLSDISVMGNDKYDAKYIVDLSGLKAGTHMLFCDLDAAKDSIQQDPYLQVDQISYIFPNRVRIVVTERKEVAGIIGLDYNVIIDDQGFVLSMSGGTDLTGLLQVTGVSMTGFQLGQRLGEGNDFTTATLVNIIDKLEEYNLISSISSIDLTTPLAITLTAKNGLKVHLGQSTDLDAKMTMLYKLLPNFISKHNITTGILYLSAKGGAVYSPTNAAENAMKAAANAATQPNNGLDTNYEDLNFLDEDGDGNDDTTGLPRATPGPTLTPAPSLPGGTSDAFSG